MTIAPVPVADAVPALARMRSTTMRCSGSTAT